MPNEQNEVEGDFSFWKQRTWNCVAVDCNEDGHKRPDCPNRKRNADTENVIMRTINGNL